MTSNKQLKDTITLAFVKAGLVGGDTEKSEVLKAELQKRNAALSEFLVSDERDIHHNKKLKTGHDEEAQVQFEPVEGGKTVITVTLPPSISPDNPHYYLVMNTVAEHCFQKSHVIPARELEEVLQRQKELGKQPAIKKATVDGKNLDTTAGLGITDHYRDLIRQKQQERDRAAEAKEQAAINAKDRLLRIRAAEVAAAEEVLSFVQRDSSDWEKMPSSTLLKKADVVLAITTHLNCLAQSIADAPAEYPTPADVTPEQLTPLRDVVEQPEDIIVEPAEVPAMVVVADPEEVSRPRRGLKRPAKFSA